MNQHKIYAIVVTFNGEKWVKKCIGSLVSEPLIDKIVLVDNGSFDGTLRAIRKFNSDKIQIVASDENLGFGKANNLGIKLALEEDADFVLLLNQDAWLLDNGLEQLITVLVKEKEIGIISPVHLDASKKFFDSGFENYISAVLNEAQKKNLLNKSYQESYFKLPFVNAACWLITKSCIERVGIFDSLFHHYGEDNNYTQRVEFHGFKIGICSSSYLVHDRKYREPNHYHQYANERYRTSLLLSMDIRNGFGRSFRNLIYDHYVNSKKNLKRNSFKHLIQNQWILSRILFSLLIVSIHRWKNKRPYIKK